MMKKLTTRMCDAQVEKKYIKHTQSTLRQLPLLSMIGSDDLVVSVSSREAFHKRLEETNKDSKVFDGIYHYRFEEPESEQAYVYLVKWCRSRFEAESS